MILPGAGILVPIAAGIAIGAAGWAVGEFESRAANRRAGEIERAYLAVTVELQAQSLSLARVRSEADRARASARLGSVRAEGAAASADDRAKVLDSRIREPAGSGGACEDGVKIVREQIGKEAPGPSPAH